MSLTSGLDGERTTLDSSERDSSPRLAGSALPALTPRQAEVLLSVERFVDARGWPPSLKELAELVGLSKSVVEEKLAALVEKGYLARDAGERRGIRILRSGEGAPVAELRALRKTTHLCDRCRREVG